MITHNFLINDLAAGLKNNEETGDEFEEILKIVIKQLHNVIIL